MSASSNSSNLVRVDLKLSAELVQCIDDARGLAPRTAFIEDTLRKSPAVRAAASRLGVKFSERRHVGGRRKKDVDQGG